METHRSVARYQSMTLVRKSDSSWMRFIARIFKLFNKDFESTYWTTIGTYCFVPSIYDKDDDWGTADWLDDHMPVVVHELKHVDQYNRRGAFLHALIYLGPSILLLPMMLLLLAASHWIGLAWASWTSLAIVVLAPLSVGLAYGRWVSEREGYLCNLAAGATIDWVVDVLGKGYLWPWPKTWMKAWFEKNLPPKS